MAPARFLNKAKLHLETKMNKFKAPLTMAAMLFGAASLAACGDREAEGETAVSEAEVSTELPETIVSDEQLQATANAAAEIAATPPTEVVVVPAGPNQAGAAAGQATTGSAVPTGNVMTNQQ